MVDDRSTTLPEEQDAAAAAALGGELLSSLDPLLMVESLIRSMTPAALLRAGANLLREVPQIALETQDAPIPELDARFRDEAFHDNLLYRRVARAYAVWEREMMRVVENEDVDWRTRERGRMLMGVITSALAPTNTLAGNPQALKLAFSTGGRSLVSGAGNFLRDLVENGGYPAQVDKKAFTVGKNLAVTKGWVIHRTEMFELVHYDAVTPEVGAVPLVLFPPPVNKYYFWDLAPGRSLIEYAVNRGVDVYTIVWRDPRPDNGNWGSDAYLAAAQAAVEVVTEVSGSDSVHMFGDCSGGMLLSMLLAHQAAVGTRRIRTGTFGVTVLDFGEPGGIGVTASDRGLEKVRQKAERSEVISATDISSTFVWMRPNDLVWRYLVDEWLMGKKAPAFDIMYWNGDGQGMPAQFAHDMTRMSLDNSLIRPGGWTALGEKLDLSAVDVDTYHVTGLTDHISPWKGCYAGARAMGGDATFVLTPTGHVQSIIYPMGKPRAAFWSGPDVDGDADAWLARASRTEDSWWEHWVDWLLERSDGTRDAPLTSGNAAHRPLTPAPGTYVLGE